MVADWAAQLAAHSEGPESDRWLAAAVAEADNLRAAIDMFARTGRPSSAFSSWSTR